MASFRLAPWFGVAAGLLLAWHGEAAWVSRWHPAVLGSAHLLILGCVVMVMLGALVQVLSVISSAAVAELAPVAGWARWSLALGAPALAAALTFGLQPLLPVAGVLLLIAFAAYLSPIGAAVLRPVGGGDSMLGVRIALLCLSVTVLLGLLLLVGHISPSSLPGFRSWTDLHLAFGLLGWVTVLIAAVSFQVLPMFFVAPDYPRWITVGVPLAIAAGLILVACGVPHADWVPAAACALWAGGTLAVLHRRKRRAADPVLRFWQVGSVALIAATVAERLAAPGLPGGALLGGTLFGGVLFVVGFVLTVMIGMLYKIVPFLVFLHLQRLCLGRPDRVALLPTMHTVIPLRRAWVQLGLHLVAAAACVAAPWFPGIGSVAAILLALDCAWLGASMHRGWSCYRRRLAAIGPAEAEPTVAADHRVAGEPVSPAAE